MRFFLCVENSTVFFIKIVLIYIIAYDNMCLGGELIGKVFNSKRGCRNIGFSRNNNKAMDST